MLLLNLGFFLVMFNHVVMSSNPRALNTIYVLIIPKLISVYTLFLSIEYHIHLSDYLFDN